MHHLVQMCHMGQQVRCDILHRRTLLNLTIHRSQIGIRPNNTPITNRPNADDVGSGSIKEEVIKIFRQTFGI